MFTANWDGIHDNETGLLGFSVAVGLSPCDDLVYKFHDPHGHLLDSSQWTYSVIMTPIPAPYTVLPGDGQDKYFWKNMSHTTEKWDIILI